MKKRVNYVVLILALQTANIVAEVKIHNIVKVDEKLTEISDDSQTESLMSAAKEKLVYSMLNQNNESNTAINELCNNISSLNSDSFQDLIKEVINDVYGKLDTKIILDNIKNLNCIDQRISGYAAVFYKMERNDEAIFKLASHIKETMSMDSYDKVHSSKRNELEQIKLELPRSVKNAVFSSAVYIRNVEHEEMLFASDIPFDEDRRSVFTWIKSYVVAHRKWVIEPDGDDFMFRNADYNEYLYAASDYFNFDDDRRSVFTWMPGGEIEQGSWTFVPDGDYVMFRNTAHQEYLYAASDYFNYGDDRRRVFTWIPGYAVGQGMWEILDCNSVEEGSDIEEAAVKMY